MISLLHWFTVYRCVLILFTPTSRQTFESLFAPRLANSTYFFRDSQHKDLTQKEIANARLQVCLPNRMYQIRNPLLLLVMTAHFMIRWSLQRILLFQQQWCIFQLKNIKNLWNASISNKIYLKSSRVGPNILQVIDFLIKFYFLVDCDQS